MSVEPLIESLVETPHVDAEILEETLGGAVPLACRTVDRLGAPVADEGLSVDDEFVAFGVAAEIVVGIQDQHTGVRAALPVEVCCRQAADAGADHGQIVAFGERRSRYVERGAVAQPMRRLEGTRMAAA